MVRSTNCKPSFDIIALNKSFKGRDINFYNTVWKTFYQLKFLMQNKTTKASKVKFQNERTIHHQLNALPKPRADSDNVLNWELIN